MAFQTDLILGLGTLLDAEGAVTFRLVGAYTPAEVGLYLDALPADPPRAVALTVYPVEDNTGTTDATVGVQFRIRGRPDNPLDVKETADAIYAVLDNATGYELGPIPVSRSWRASGANLPADENRRQESTQNYYLQVNRTSPHRRD